MNARKRTGMLGERAARRHLEDTGYRILGVNVRIGRGEIDIVAEQSGDIVFAEVRTRRSLHMGAPEESITPAKRERMLVAAQAYLQTHGLESRNWRIDLVAVELDALDRVGRLSVIPNAIEA